METIEKLLRSELEEELEALGEAELGSDDYKVAVEGITKLMDRQIEISLTLNTSLKEMHEKSIQILKFSR